MRDYNIWFESCERYSDNLTKKEAIKDQYNRNIKWDELIWIIVWL